MIPPKQKPTLAMVVVFGLVNTDQPDERVAIVTGLNDSQEICLWRSQVGCDESPIMAATRCTNRHFRDVLSLMDDLPDLWLPRDLCLMDWIDTPEQRVEIHTLRWLMPERLRPLSKGRMRFIPLDTRMEDYGPIEALSDKVFNDLPWRMIEAQGGLMDYPALPNP